MTDIEQFIRDNFTVKELYGVEAFQILDTSNMWVDLEPFCQQFSDSSVVYDELIDLVGNTGFESVLDTWKEEGLLN